MGFQKIPLPSCAQYDIIEEKRKGGIVIVNKEELLHIFSHMPTLETERLILRPAKVTDAEDMFDYAKNPDVTRYLLWSPHTNVLCTRHYLEFLGKRYRLGMHYEWAILLKTTRRMIGTCGFVRIDCANRSAEIGYVLHPDHHKMGIMPEAAREVLRFGFERLGLHRIEARYMVGNEPSRRVMEKLGMKEEGVARSLLFVKGAYRDIGTYAILADEFKTE